MHESLAAQLPALLIRGYKFCDSGKRGRHIRNLVGQIDQQILLAKAGFFEADGHRCAGSTTRLIEHIMRHKTAVTKCPQQLIKQLRLLGTGRVNVHGVLEPIRFLGEPASKLIPRRFTRGRENVEINPCHIA